MESGFQCPVHMTRFNTVDHPLVVLATCVHSNCQQHLRQELDNKGHFLCPVCRVVVFPPLAKIVNEIATFRANAQLAATEIQCEIHRENTAQEAKVLGEYFCSDNRAVYCDACRHKEGKCCRKPECTLAVEVMMQLREFTGSSGLPPNVILKLSLAGDQDAQVNYNLLRTCVNLKEGKEVGINCHKHSNKSAKYIHEDTLKVYCTECGNSEEYLELLPKNSIPLRKAIGKYLSKVHCYSVPLDVLKSLRQYQNLNWAEKVELASSVGEIRKQLTAPVPRILYCGICLQSFSSLRVLHSQNGKHAICNDCVIASGTNCVCPLDEVVVEAVEDEELSEASTASTTAEYLKDRYATLQLYWREIPIPRPKVMESQIKYIQRFSNVYPPIGAPDDQYDSSIRGWCMNLDPRQVEPVVLSVSKPVTLVGVTIATPVEKSTRIYLKSVSVFKEGLVCELLSAPVALYGGLVATDVFFAEGLLLDAGIDYTLSLTLTATTSRPVITFRGNQHTASTILTSDDNVQWSFRRCEDYSVVTGGDNARSGPLLRLFYT